MFVTLTGRFDTKLFDTSPFDTSRFSLGINSFVSFVYRPRDIHAICIFVLALTILYRNCCAVSLLKFVSKRLCFERLGVTAHIQQIIRARIRVLTPKLIGQEMSSSRNHYPKLGELFGLLSLFTCLWNNDLYSYPVKCELQRRLPTPSQLAALAPLKSSIIHENDIPHPLPPQQF